MKTYKWLDLQLFADGAGDGVSAGAETGATVVNHTDDAYESRLRELGVPEDKIKRQRAYKSSAARRQATAKQQETQPVAAAETKAAPETDGGKDTEEGKGTDAPETEPQSAAKRMTWDEIKADPEYKEQINNIVRARLKDADTARTQMQIITPMLEVIARKYGMDPENIDYEALNKKVNDDDEYYASAAMENGTDVAAEKAIDQKRRDEARAQRYSQEQERQRIISEHFQNLRAQEAELKKVYPNFSLDKELENPAFVRITAPGTNVPLKNAYIAFHADEISAAQAQVVAQKTAQDISRTIQAGKMRPNEAKASQAPVNTPFKMLSLAEVRAGIDRAARQGKRYYPDGTIR